MPIIKDLTPINLSDRSETLACEVRQQKGFLLDAYFRQISEVILARQNPITGLLPASTAVTAHGDYTVRSLARS
jgi:Glycosyl hydrolases family 15